MNLNEEIKKLADEYEPYIIDCRRKVHTFAEVAMQEDKTHAFILEEAKKLGLPYEEVPTTSVIVKMDTGRPGMVVALRADIDALPLAENPNNLAGPRTCVSEKGNTCHACGHDAHTSMLLGAMQVLYRRKDKLNGTVLFCFEEGEEPNSGVEALLKALEKYDVDRCWAIHVYAELEEGKMCVDPGPRMAGAAIIDVTFVGKSGHGSRPDLAVNPVFCGANFLNNLSVAFSNQITAGKTVTMGLTMFHAGEVGNVIPETARIQGSYRFFDLEEGKKAVRITSRWPTTPPPCTTARWNTAPARTSSAAPPSPIRRVPRWPTGCSMRSCPRALWSTATLGMPGSPSCCGWSSIPACSPSWASKIRRPDMVPPTTTTSST